MSPRDASETTFFKAQNIQSWESSSCRISMCIQKALFSDNAEFVKREQSSKEEAAAVAFRMWKWLWKRQMIVFSKTAFAGRGSRGWFVFTADPLPSQMQVDFISTKPRFYSSTIFSENKKNEWTIGFFGKIRRNAEISQQHLIVFVF